MSKSLEEEFRGLQEASTHMQKHIEDALKFQRAAARSLVGEYRAASELLRELGREECLATANARDGAALTKRMSDLLDKIENGMTVEGHVKEGLTKGLGPYVVNDPEGLLDGLYGDDALPREPPAGT